MAYLQRIPILCYSTLWSRKFFVYFTNRVGSGSDPAVPPHHLAYVLRTKAVSTKLTC